MSDGAHDPRGDDPQRIDLHSHSHWSDGTCGVEELFSRAQAADLDVLALTDHDTMGGWEQLPAAVRASGVAAVPGIEVSAEHGRTSVHLLALLVEGGEDTALARLLSSARASRLERARTMVELLEQDHPIDWEMVREQANDDATVVGRPHIADALVQAGVVEDRSSAFTELLSSRGPYYIPYAAPAPEEVIAAIHDAGGVAIVAHPGSASRDGDLPEQLLHRMIDAGLDGMEVEHREHDEIERRRLRELAHAHDLLMTGGSDYHGSGKPNRLGENLTQPDVLAAITRRATSSTEVIRP